VIVSAGRISTGRRFVVAVAAPVTILIDPGPAEAVHAKVDMRRVALA